MSNIDSRTKAPTHHRFKDDNDFDSIVAQDHAHFEFFRSLLEAADARSVADIDTAFSTIAGMNPDGLIVLLDGVTLTARPRIVHWATNRRLPTIFQIRDFVAAGGLMSYGLNYCQNYRRAAIYLDKILRGTRPADLPVELPTTFELVVSVKAAKAIGLTIPEAFLLRADEVIE